MSGTTPKGFRTRIAVVLVVAGLAATALTTPASGAPHPIPVPPGGGESVQEAARMSAQLDLVGVADRVEKVARASRHPQLGGIRLNVEQHTVEVWWRGPAPAAVKAAADGARRGTKVVIRPAAHTEAELVTVARSLVRSGSVPGLNQVAPAVDGSALEVTVTAATAAAGPAAVARARTASTRLHLAVPLRLSAGPAPRKMSRYSDTPPFWGGAAISSNGLACTSGFPVIKRGLFGVETTRGLLTALHCGSDVFRTGGGQTVVGHGAPVARGSAAWTLDSQFVDTGKGSSKAAPYIYDGGSGTGEFSKPVVGQIATYVGTWVCTSGASTGTHCNTKVIQTNAYIPYPDNPGENVWPVAVGQEQSWSAAVGPGDSGAPVFSLSRDPNKVLAVGETVAGFGDTVACPGFSNITCRNGVIFTQINDVLQAKGVKLLTQ